MSSAFLNALATIAGVEGPSPINHKHQFAWNRGAIAVLLLTGKMRPQPGWRPAMRKLMTFAVAVVAFASIGAFASSDKAEAFGWCGASYYRSSACGCPSYYRSGVYSSRGIYRRAAVRRYVAHRRIGVRARRR